MSEYGNYKTGALTRMCRRRVQPGVGQYARQAIAAVLNQAESVGAETGESLLKLAQAALPAGPVVWLRA
jgi:hypothetical protein